MNEVINQVLSHISDLNVILEKEVITKELFEHNYKYNKSDLNTNDLNLFLVSLYLNYLMPVQSPIKTLRKVSIS